MEMRFRVLYACEIKNISKNQDFHFWIFVYAGKREVSVCREPRSYPMLVDGAMSSIAGDSNDGVIAEVAS